MKWLLMSGLLFLCLPLCVNGMQEPQPVVGTPLGYENAPYLIRMYPIYYILDPVYVWVTRQVQHDLIDKMFLGYISLVCPLLVMLITSVAFPYAWCHNQMRYDPNCYVYSSIAGSLGASVLLAPFIYRGIQKMLERPVT